MILYSGYNIIKIINILVFTILLVLTYKGIIVLNEEILVAFCFLLFVYLAVLLLSDVAKASIFSRILQIRNKFNDLKPIIEKEDKNFYNTVYSLGDLKKYDNINTDYNQIVNNFKNEFQNTIRNILTISESSLSDISNKFNNLLKNIYVYDLFIGLRIEVILFLYFIVLYVYYIPILFVLYIYNNITNKNNNVYLTLFNNIKYKEYKYSINIYKSIVRELFTYYSNYYKIPKKNIKKI
jgi:hypothetical protein